jgi:hypothetical protein
MYVIDFIRDNVNFIIAIAAFVQAIFTVVLVVWYVKRQTKIMERQIDISDRQTRISEQSLNLNKYAVVANELQFLVDKCLNEQNRYWDELYKLEEERKELLGREHSKEEEEDFNKRYNIIRQLFDFKRLDPLHEQMKQMEIKRQEMEQLIKNL